MIMVVTWTCFTSGPPPFNPQPKVPMNTLEQHFRIALKPARVLLAVAILGTLALSYAPAPWRFIGGMAQMFAMGMLAAQRMNIWESVQEQAVTSTATPEGGPASVTE